MEKESQKYQKMLEDVENIISDIGDGNVELDEIVEKIERGYELIKTMRKRLDETKLKVDKLREEHTED